MAILESFPDLETVDLTGAAKITDAGLLHLKRMIKLKTIVLAKTGFTKSGVAALKAALPNLKVEME